MKKSVLVFVSFFALSIFGSSAAWAEADFYVQREGGIEVKLPFDGKIRTARAIHGTMTGAHSCATLENYDFFIPAGRYEVVVTKSEEFSRKASKRAGREVVVCLPLLLRVPDRDGIRIHAGNYPWDSTGCILPGQEEKKRVKVGDGYEYKRKDGWICSSAVELKEIKRLIEDDAKRKIPSFITISDPPCSTSECLLM